MDNKRRSGRRAVDREHEHGPGRQQDALFGQLRAYQTQQHHPHGVRGPGSRCSVPGHRQ